jgi:UDP-N-acetylmuramate dehydrogenase
MNLERAHGEIVDIMPEERVLTDQPMSEHTSFKTGGKADLLVLPASASQLKNALRLLYAYDVPYIVVGRGTNILVGDSGIRGAVVKIADAYDEISIKGDLLTAESGAALNSIVKAGHEHGLVGLEFLAGIPGSVGGAVVMNAGAYGGEVKQYIQHVEVINGAFEKKEIIAADLGLSYRTSNIQNSNKYITKAVFRLEKGNLEKAKGYMKELSKKRRDTQPLTSPSAGSIFKRPVGHYAGKLVEQAGLKGHTIGGASVSSKHAGFIINNGGATSKDIFTLINYIQDRVYSKEGVKLETEVKILGEF